MATLVADGIIELADIRVLYLEGFASWRAAAERLREALALLGSPDTPINPVQVSVGPSVPHVPDAGRLWKQLQLRSLTGLGPVEDRPSGLREFVVIDPAATTFASAAHPRGLSATVLLSACDGACSRGYAARSRLPRETGARAPHARSERPAHSVAPVRRRRALRTHDTLPEAATSHCRPTSSIGIPSAAGAERRRRRRARRGWLLVA